MEDKLLRIKKSCKNPEQMSVYKAMEERYRAMKKERIAEANSRKIGPLFIVCVITALGIAIMLFFATVITLNKVMEKKPAWLEQQEKRMEHERQSQQALPRVSI